MAIKIGDTMYVTILEAADIMGRRDPLIHYWVYGGEFKGIIQVDDHEPLFFNEWIACRIKKEALEKIKERKQNRKRNFFLIPLEEVFAKMDRLVEKKLRSSMTKEEKAAKKEQKRLERENDAESRVIL